MDNLLDEVDYEIEELVVGNVYASKQALQSVLARYEANTNMKMKTVASNTTRLNLQCIGTKIVGNEKEPCAWKVYAKPNGSDQWVIATGHFEHSCTTEEARQRSSFGYKEILPLIMGQLRDNREYSPTNLVQDLRREHGLEMQYSVVHEAKKRCLDLIDGDKGETFTQARDYFASFVQ